MAKKEATPADAGAPSGGKSKLKLILLIVVGLLLAIGLSVGGTWFFLSKSLKAEKTEEVASEAAKPGKQPALYEILAPAFVSSAFVSPPPPSSPRVASATRRSPSSPAISPPSPPPGV